QPGDTGSGSFRRTTHAEKRRQKESRVEIGMVGLGRMGANMAQRLREAGHTVVGFDVENEARDVGSLASLVDRLVRPRIVWIMVPAGDATRQAVLDLRELLDERDLVVDGGNSRYTDAELNAERLTAKGIGFVDCGVSGGVWGYANGYALMVGG